MLKLILMVRRSVRRCLCVCLLGLISLMASAQHQTADFLHALINVTIEPELGDVSGEVQLQVLMLATTREISIDANALEIQSVQMGGKPMPYAYDGKRIRLKGNFKKGKRYSPVISYRAKPAKAMYFMGWNPETATTGSSCQTAPPQVWTQGQGMDHSHWVPITDDLNDKLTFELLLKVPDGLDCIASGILQESYNEGKYRVWHYRTSLPMSSYLLAVVIGQYAMEKGFSASGIPIEKYYYPGEKGTSGPAYRYSEELFDYLEREIGVGFPWETYRQVPVRDFPYAGMENTGLTLFSDIYLVDSLALEDRSYLRVNAHELAHQWFGNLVTETSASEHWLHEGFATYYALLAERQLFGEDHYYLELYKTYLQLSEQTEKGKGESLRDPRAGSLTFYEKGAWALHRLREITGDEVFRETVRQFLKRYQYSNARVEDFLHTFPDSLSGRVHDFQIRWIDQTGYPKEEALESLRENAFIRAFLELKEQWSTRVMTNGEKVRFTDSVLHTNSYYPIREWMLKNGKGFAGDTLLDPLRIRFLKDSLAPLRWAALESFEKIPAQLKDSFAFYAAHQSYAGKEYMLYRWWSEFEDRRWSYLTQLETDCNRFSTALLTLKAALTMLTPEAGEAAAFMAYEQLRGFTASQWDPETRQRAFTYFMELHLWDEELISRLLHSCFHPLGTYAKYCRSLLTDLNKDPGYSDLIWSQAENLPAEQQDKLKAWLKPQVKTDKR